jgi:hypothetical protein
MMNYNGVYMASHPSTSYSADEIVLMELQVPDNCQIELLRAWVGPAEGTDPVAEVQEICLYLNDGPATGGTGLTEQEVWGTANAAALTVAVANATVAATPVDYAYDAFHAFNGWLYVPVPEERIRVVGGTTNDNIGIRLPVAPDAAMVLSVGMVWGELA